FSQSVNQTSNSAGFVTDNAFVAVFGNNHAAQRVHTLPLLKPMLLKMQFLYWPYMSTWSASKGYTPGAITIDPV
ncbi:hypothetical protein SK128_027896, partial [Halocaridina rubra]